MLVNVSAFVTPNWNNLAENGNAFGGQTIDAAAERVAFAVPVPKTGTLKGVGFRLGTVTQAPASGLKVSFQTIDLVTGDPPEPTAADQFRTITAGLTANTWVDTTATGLMTSDGTDTGVKRSVTQGQHIAVVIEFASFAAGDSLQVSAFTSTARSYYVSSAWCALFTAAWAKNTSLRPDVELIYDDATTEPVPGILPLSGLASEAATTATTPDEIALKWTPQFRCRVKGMAIVWAVGGGANFDLVLYNAAGTVLASVSVDEDETLQSGTTGAAYFFTASVVLEVGSAYYFTFKPTTATSASVFVATVGNALAMDALEHGSEMIYSSRTAAGAWTDSTTKRPVFGVIIDQLDDGKYPRARLSVGV